MAIEYVGGIQAVSSGTLGGGVLSLTSLSGGIASQPAEGDVVVVAFGIATAGRTPSPTITGNNTGSYSHVSGSPLLSDDDYDAHLSVFWQRMGATPDTTITRSGSGSADDGLVILVHVFRGVDAATPFDVTPTTATGIDTGQPDPPSITPATVGAWVYAVGASAFSNIPSFTTSDLSNWRTAGVIDVNDAEIGAGTIGPWSSGAVDPAQFGGGTTNASASWSALTLALRPAAGTVDDLTATGIASGAPAVGAPALGQEHALTPSSVDSGAFALGAPSIGQTHALTPSSVASGAFALGAPALGQIASLEAIGVNLGAPGIDVPPGISQTHSLAAEDASGGAIEVGGAVLAQVHALVATPPIVASVEVGFPPLGSGMLALGAALGAPVLGAPALAQEHVLGALGAVLGAPVLGAPVLGAVAALGAPDPIALGAPVLGAPVLGVVHVLTLWGVETGTPLVGTPALGQVHQLVSVETALLGHVLGAPVLSVALPPATLEKFLGQLEIESRSHSNRLASRGGWIELESRSHSIVIAPRGGWVELNEQEGITE